jgi:uncharacterized protein (DUF2384 family)
MPHTLSDPEREQLERLEDLIDQWRSKLDEDLASAPTSGPLDDEYVERFLDTSRRLSARLHKELPPDLDPYALAEVRGHLLDGLSAIYDSGTLGPLDLLDEFVVRAEAIRHIFRDALDTQPGCDEADAQALLNCLAEWLPRISRKDLGSLIGVSERQVQRIMKDGGDSSRRLQMVSRMVALLRHAWTPEGVVAWFYRPRPDLGDRPPIDVLDDEEYEQDLMLAVRRGRAQHGS